MTRQEWLLGIARKRRGILRTADVVEAARDPESPGHGWFEWSDTAAAEKYRKWQARQLIRTLVDVVPNDDSGETFRVFVSLSSDRDRAGGGYRMLTKVLSNETAASRLLSDALSELARVRAKYEHLQALATVWSALDKVQRSGKAGVAVQGRAKRSRSKRDKAGQAEHDSAR